MLAFHGKDEVKALYVARVAAHKAADEIIQGAGWDGVRGCAIGCTLDGYTPWRYPIELGIPLEIAHLEDRIHEGLPLSDAKEWPSRFIAAPRVGADLSLVWPEFAIWLLTDPTHGVIRFAKREASRAAIETVAQFYRDRVPRGSERWRAARDQALEARRESWAADAAAAYAYAAAAAADAAAYAAYAYAAAYAAADAAAAAAYAYAAADAAAAQHWRVCADKLVELLAAA